ncbi:hypothetical protein HBN82_00350 [Pseudomonas lundensis]|nr:hypothetical protein [Pseudomonas lundensis]NNA14315.1 hypothetical protein [Pseudomonas lundensis]NNA26074.1 hypothetical protein [Pseudomonas lundensis]
MASPTWKGFAAAA